MAITEPWTIETAVEAPETTPAPTGKAVADIRDLHVTFTGPRGRVQALRGVSLQVQAGEIVALVGESGSGKSVLGATLLGLLPEEANPVVTGSVIVDGVDMVCGSAPQRRKVLRRSLGAVFQDPLTSLNPTMRLGRQLREKGATDHVVRRRLGEVGIGDVERRVRQYPHELSGGLRQRAMIAMATSTEAPDGGDHDEDTDVAPRLVIADEPTTALDVSVQAQIVLLLDRLRTEHGCAVLLITHDLGVAASVADRVAVMYAGRVCEIGPTAEIVGRPAHPYTAGLLGARLSLDSDRTVSDPLPGHPPDPSDPPNGCAFAERCGRAEARCASTPPPLDVRSGGPGQVACHLPLVAGAAPPPTTGQQAAAGADAPSQPVTVPAPARPLLPAEVDVEVEVEVEVEVDRKPALVLDHVSKTFDLRRRRLGSARVKLNAVVDVSLTVPAGGSVALVGESGCGKTTTLRMATGLLRPDSGAVRWARGAARPQLVFQDAGASLTPWMTVLAQIVERLEHLGVERADRPAQAMALLRRVGLDERAARARPRELSGGQRQRAVIARALASRPSLLVCDEPVSALDASLAVRVLALLEELREDLGVALLVVTHDLAAARRIGDEVAVMYLGSVVERAPAAELFERPRHPYTQGLLAAVPTIEVGHLAPTLAGEPPSPIGDRRGCPFVNRCPLATTDRCHVQAPVLHASGPSEVACHLVD